MRFTCSHTSIQHAALGLDAENKAQATPHTETVCVCVCVFTWLPISWPISISYVIIHVASWIPVAVHYVVYNLVHETIRVH